MAKKRMPILYGIIGIFREFLAHNLAKSQYFSVRPSLFDYYYQTYQITCNYIITCKFWLNISKNVDSMWELRKLLSSNCW